MGLVTVGPRGLGAYPTNEDGSPNKCFDPNRPGILPYWLDTFSEERCRWAQGNILGEEMPWSGWYDPSISPEGGVDVSVPGQAPMAPGSIISGIAGIAIVVGLAYVFLGLYLRKGR